MRAARFAALLAVAALAAAAGTARAQCAGDPAVFKHTPSVDGSRDARAALLGALAGCGAAETLEETFEAVTSGNPASLFGGAVPASYSGTCSSLPTSILASASADLLGARALACSEVGAAVTLDFGDEGVEGFGLYAFDAQQPVTVRLLGAGGAVVAEFDVFTAAELAAGQFAHAFWGVQTRGLGVRSVQIEQTGVTSNAWFLDGLVAVRPPAACSTPCKNGGADDDCDGICDRCDNNFGGALCDECPTACENGGADDDCDGVCEGCRNNFGGALCNECSTACKNGGADDDCDGVCDGCRNNFGGALCNECSTACSNGGTDDDCDGVCEGCDNLFDGALCDECLTPCDNGGVDEDCDGVCEACDGLFRGDHCEFCPTVCENGGEDDDCDGVCTGCDNEFTGDVCEVCSTGCENGGVDEDCDGVCTGCDNNFGGALCNECSTACKNGGVDEDCDGVCDGCDGMFGGDLCDKCMTSCANGGADDDCDGVCTGCDNLFGGALCDECSTACERDTDCDGVCDLMCTGGKVPSADGSECVCPDGQQDVDGVCLLVPAGCTAARGGSASERHTHVSTGLCAGIVWNECTA